MVFPILALAKAYYKLGFTWHVCALLMNKIVFLSMVLITFASLYLLGICAFYIVTQSSPGRESVATQRKKKLFMEKS